MSIAQKQINKKPLSDEHKRKISEAIKIKHKLLWKN